LIARVSRSGNREREAVGNDLRELAAAAAQLVAAWNTLNHAIAHTWAALAELHTTPFGSGGPVYGQSIEILLANTWNWMSYLEGIHARRVDRAGDLGIDLNELDHLVRSAIRAAETAPYGSALTHGTLHPDFIYFDEAAPGRVTFGETSVMHLSMTSDGTPIGPPELDVIDLLWALADYAQVYGLTQNEVAAVLRSRQTYDTQHGAALVDGRVAVVIALRVLQRLYRLIQRDEPIMQQELELPRWGIQQLRDLVGAVDPALRRWPRPGQSKLSLLLENLGALIGRRLRGPFGS
jgi:hypothetical protein